jgi:hypothetical protein
LINRRGSNLCGKFKKNKKYKDEMKTYVKDMETYTERMNNYNARRSKSTKPPARPTRPQEYEETNRECMISIDISKIIKENKENVRVVIPSTTYDESKKVHTTIGENVIDQDKKAPDIKEIKDENDVHVDIYPACTPELLYTWFGCHFNKCSGTTMQNTAFAAITAQEVIMSGNYPIDILEVVACHPRGHGYVGDVMKLLQQPMPIREYCKARAKPETLIFVEERKEEPTNDNMETDSVLPGVQGVPRVPKVRTNFLKSLLETSDANREQFNKRPRIS